MDMASYGEISILSFKMPLMFENSFLSLYFFMFHLTRLNLKFALSVQATYRKNSKNWGTLNYYRDCPTNGIVGFYSAILRSKDADRITNRVDTDQTAS